MATVRSSLIALVVLVAAAGAVAGASDVDLASPSPSPSACPSPPPVALPSSTTAPIATPPPSPLTLAIDPCASAAPSPASGVVSEVTVEAGDLWFRPEELTVPAQGEITLTLVDGGVITHNLTVDELGLLLVAAPGRRASVTLVDPPPGTYPFYCSISGHREAGMVGTLVVE